MNKRNRDMISPLTAGILIISLLFCAKCSVAGVEDSAQSRPESVDGFWPTTQMAESVIRRWAIESGAKYELRPEQQVEVERMLGERWMGFLADNRQELQPLLNEYIEAHLQVEPPSADQVADWAAKAMPVFEKLKANIEAGEDEVRGLLSEEQLPLFESERSKRKVQLRAAEGTLRRWSVGNFKQHEWWNPPTKKQGGDGSNEHSNIPRPERLKEIRPPLPANADLPPRAVEELTAWERYVMDYCEKYELDRSQRNAAQSILRELRARAADHLHLNRDRIAAVEEAIVSPEESDAESVTNELRELYGPVDQMFQELQERINRLPTPAQKLRGDAKSNQSEPLPE